MLNVRIGNYYIQKLIGKGQSSKVWLAVDMRTDSLVAIKVLKQVDKNGFSAVDIRKQKTREEVLKLLSHPNIIRLYHIYENLKPGHIYLVMEYAPNGSLMDYLVSVGRIPESDAKGFFAQIISGLAYCHSNRIVHRDIKLDNILLGEENQIKISDFGMSNVSREGELLKTFCGSPNYAAPELLEGVQYSGPQVDIWSTGVVLYAMLFGDLPFRSGAVALLYDKIKRGHFTVENNYGISDTAISLIKEMLTIDPAKRITMSQIYNHPWIIGHPQLDQSYMNGFMTKLLVVEEVNRDVSKYIASRLKVDESEVYRMLIEGSDEILVIVYKHLLENLSGSGKDISESIQELARSQDWDFSDLVGQQGRLRLGFGGVSSSLPPENISWSLGFLVRDSLDSLIKGLFDSLKHMDFQWKALNQFSFKVRKINDRSKNRGVYCVNIFTYTEKNKRKGRRGAPRGEARAAERKPRHMGAYIKKFQKNQKYDQRTSYLLDFRLLSGNVFDYFEFCNMIRISMIDQTNRRIKRVVKPLRKRRSQQPDYFMGAWLKLEE